MQQNAYKKKCILVKLLNVMTDVVPCDHHRLLGH